MISNKSVSTSTVSHIAKLCRISISQDELTSYASTLSRTLGIAHDLFEVDAKDVEPLITLDESCLQRRADVIAQDGPSVDEILSNSPKSKYDYFVVPKMIDRE